MCGPAGSGKSTYARVLEQHGMFRMSLDLIRWQAGTFSVSLPPEREAEVEDTLRSRLLELVTAGRDVVPDLSFWSRGMRQEYRQLLEPTGVVPETVYFATAREVVLDRVRLRRGRHAGDVVVSAVLAARYFDNFEPPTPEEGPLTVITGS
ncbi:MAG: ATP-binding protein [Actinomycetota bacterium]|nr:ATP-binding protein [Actinomycetota bacterium]